MGIKLKWDNQADQNLDAMEVYRSNRVIDINNPGQPLVTLAGTATEYEDNNVQNKNLYHYRLAAKKGDQRGWGSDQLIGYFSETGPGRETPIRGDWNSGWMDYVVVADFITTADLVTKMGGVAFATAATQGWYKLCHRGKVLFMPTSAIFTLSYNEAYAAGILFGEDGFGQLPSGVAGSVNQKKVVEIAGLEYIVRMVRVTDKPTSQFITDIKDTETNEYRELMCRLMTMASDGYTALRYNKLYDTTGLPGGALGPHKSAAGTCCAIAASTTNAIVNQAIATRVAAMVVLELIMP